MISFDQLKIDAIFNVLIKLHNAICTATDFIFAVSLFKIKSNKRKQNGSKA